MNLNEIENESATDTEATKLSEHSKGAKRERLIMFFFAILVLILDYASKEIVRTNLPLYTYWAPFPGLENFFRITHTNNTGVAFGMFQFGSANLVFSIFVSIPRSSPNSSKMSSACSYSALLCHGFNW